MCFMLVCFGRSCLLIYVYLFVFVFWGVLIDCVVCVVCSVCFSYLCLFVVSYASVCCSFVRCKSLVMLRLCVCVVVRVCVLLGVSFILLVLCFWLKKSLFFVVLLDLVCAFGACCLVNAFYDCPPLFCMCVAFLLFVCVCVLCGGGGVCIDCSCCDCCLCCLLC